MRELEAEGFSDADVFEPLQAQIAGAWATAPAEARAEARAAAEAAQRAAEVAARGGRTAEERARQTLDDLKAAFGGAVPKLELDASRWSLRMKRKKGRK